MTNMNFTPYQYLPLYVKVAIERLDQNSDMRSGAQLDELIDAYAKTYGTTCDEHERESAHHICTRRFAGTFMPV